MIGSPRKVDGEGGMAEARAYVGTTPLSGLAQFHMLVSMGVTRGKAVAEVGCGALHLAKPLAAFLDAGRYSGMDPALWLREYALADDPVLADVLRARHARFSTRDDFAVLDTFGAVDVVFAHSVLSHASYDQLGVFMVEAARAIQHRQGVAVASLNLAAGRPATMHSEWEYPSGVTVDLSDVLAAAKDAGLSIRVDDDAAVLYRSWCPTETHDWIVMARR